MGDNGLTVLDGSTLRTLELHLPDSPSSFKGAELLTIAETSVWSSLHNISLPETLKSNALKRIHIDAVNFSSTEFDREEATSKLKDYVVAIADELKDDPIVLSVLDGSLLRMFLEDEDDFAMLAENLFTDLDLADKGKIKKSEIRNALVQMGVDLGVPPFSELPLMDDILKKHGAEGEELLGQAQFAESLQPVLQDVADALAEKHIVIIQNIKIHNGSTLRKILDDDEQLNSVIEKIVELDDTNDERGFTEAIKTFIEKNGPIVGLPRDVKKGTSVLYLDQAFSEVDNKKTAENLDRDKCKVLVKDILGKLAKQLEALPFFHGLED